jgi:hypothetical protein
MYCGAMVARPSGMPCQAGQLGGATEGDGWYSGLFDTCAAAGTPTAVVRVITPIKTQARIRTSLLKISGSRNHLTASRHRANARPTQTPPRAGLKQADAIAPLAGITSHCYDLHSCSRTYYLGWKVF